MTPLMISYAVAALLVVAALLDCRTGRIPNWLAMVGVGLFVVKLALFPESVAIWPQLALAVGVLVGGFGLFAAGAFGAGAVKLAFVTALFVPVDMALWLLGVLVAAIIASLVLFGTLRALFGGEDSGWSVLRRRVIPLAVPIAMTGIVGLFVF